MKTIDLSPIPELTSDIIKRAGFKIRSINGSYINKKEMSLRTIKNDTIEFDDPKNIWSIEEYGLKLEISCEIKDSSKFFENQSVAMTGDTLGIAIRVCSNESRQRLVFDQNIILKEDDIDKSSFILKANIPPGKLRIFSIFEVLLYVKESQNRKSGTVLGVLSSLPIVFENNDSIFPITTEKSEDNYLWKLQIQSEDPHIDSFIDSVRICFNEKHPNYKELKFDINPMESGLFLEILCNSIITLIEWAIQHPAFNDMVENKDLREGSLGLAIYCMLISDYGSNYNDVLLLNKDVHNYIFSNGVFN